VTSSRDLTSSGKKAWLLALLVAVAILLMPAVYNRFPILFPDADAYFTVAYNNQWTLDRSGFYGLFLKLFALLDWTVVGLWLAIAAQAAIVAAVLLATIRKLAPGISPPHCTAIILLTALASSLPWHVSQIMPDAFTGALVLLAWLAASRDVRAPGTALLWLATALLTLLHYTHLPLFLAAALTALLLERINAVPWKEIGKRLVATASVGIAVVAAHVTVNGMLFDRWTMSPMGGWFLFARVHEDGLATDWIARHCGHDAPKPLCEIRTTLPRDSQALLWWKGSPLFPHIQANVGSPDFWRWTDMMSAAAAGSIREEPVRFAGNSIGAAGRQLVNYKTLDDQCPSECTSPNLKRFRPDAAPSLAASRQLMGQTNKPLIRTITGWIEAIALILLVPLFVIALRRRDKVLQGFLATIAAALVANAAITGALSDVQPRYQSRVVWLAVLALFVAAVRLSGRSRDRAGRSGLLVTEEVGNDLPDEHGSDDRYQSVARIMPAQVN